ncbi:MAG TPA: hypothetical protein VK972_05745 [Wenzhouxiangella sp.]|nr:hypothetical protein [Wenzhouxiangella sp.]
MKRISTLPGSSALLAILLIAAFGAGYAEARPPHGWSGWPPPSEYYHLEHPQHRLAWWYANQSMRQSQQAREMACGFTGQRWALDWELHYRWALRAAPKRAYQRIEERDRHLSTCRSRKLRNYQRSPYRRGPGGYGRG